jgi:hypothetical protein
LAFETIAKKGAQARERLRTLSLPPFLSAIETVRNLSLAFLILCGSALAISVVIDFQRGISPPATLRPLVTLIWISAVTGLLEEILFRGFTKRYFGNGGLLIGTIIWIILHQFYAGVTTVYRLPGDILYGIFYLKLWRGRLWRLALIIHPLYNVAIIGGWQILKMCLK